MLVEKDHQGRHLILFSEVGKSLPVIVPPNRTPCTSIWVWADIELGNSAHVVSIPRPEIRG